MITQTKKRIIFLVLSISALFITNWIELFLQRKQHLIGGGISRSLIFLLINLHVVFIVILLYIIIRQSIKLGVERHKRLPGSSFKRNLLFAFTLFSVIPSFFIFFMAGKFITTSIDHWFQARISKGLTSSIALHQAQTETLRKELSTKGESLALEFSLNQTIDCSSINIPLDTYHLNSPFDFTSSLRKELLLWRRYRRVNDRSTANLLEQFKSLINSSKPSAVFDFFGSLYWVKHLEDGSILIVAHRFPEHIRQSLIDIQTSYYDYQQLKSMRNPLYKIYMLTFALATILILFLSIWCAFFLARRISKPIQELLKATSSIKQGNYNIYITHDQESDLQQLAQAFNDMTQALKMAYHELKIKNQEMLQIFEHIHASVFVLNKYGRVIMCNRAAKELALTYCSTTRLKNKKIRLINQNLQKDLFSLIKKLNKGLSSTLSQEITLNQHNGIKNFILHMTRINNHTDQKELTKDLLIVIEDLTDVVTMSKTKAWQQAARQVAHEIKNPLTPIQLATQRLQRKFHNQLNNDPAFMRCTNTILSQVHAMKELVSHFSEFASMPEPIFEFFSLNDVIEELITFYRISYPTITFTYKLPNLLMVKSDRKKIKQILINLIDNSIRALLEDSKEKEKSVVVSAQSNYCEKNIHILVFDNGPGINDEIKETLFLPYVSGNKKSTGLGLAIVRDLVTQLGGSINLIPQLQGTKFHIRIPF